MSDLLKRLLLPGIVFQSVLVGGAYATGREIVEYGARFGPAGLWSVLALGLGFGIMSALSYEFARVTRCFDYRALVRELIGPAWPLFDLLYVTMVIVVIAVVSAATGSIAEQVLGVPYALGVGLVVVAVGVINGAGRATIERFKSVGSTLLYLGYVAFAVAVLGAGGDRAWRLITAPGESTVPLTTLLVTGLLYAGYNLSGIPATLFTLDRLTSRRDSIIAGALTGLLSTIPFLLTFLAVMVFYPDQGVLGAEVPWLVMLERSSAGWLIAVYALVVLWTLIETSVGMIHAVTDRLSAARIEHGGAALTSRQAAALAAALLIAAAALSRWGIIALVAQGYTAMAYGFLLLYALPLLTRGVARIARAR